MIEANVKCTPKADAQQPARVADVRDITSGNLSVSDSSAQKKTSEVNANDDVKIMDLWNDL